MDRREALRGIGLFGTMLGALGIAGAREPKAPEETVPEAADEDGAITDLGGYLVEDDGPSYVVSPMNYAAVRTITDRFSTSCLLTTDGNLYPPLAHQIASLASGGIAGGSLSSGVFDIRYVRHE